MAKPPVSRYGRKHDKRTGHERQGPVMGRGTKITSLPTAELLARDREAERLHTSERDIGGSGSIIYDRGSLWFITQPRVPQRFITHIDVSAVVGVSEGFDPRESDNYFGIWPQAAEPTDAEVKAGTGAVANGHASALGVPHGSQIDHRFNDPDVTVGEVYRLHWLAEHLGEGASVRGNAATFAIDNSAPMGAPYITGTEQVGSVLTCNVENISDPDGLPDVATYGYQWYRNGDPIPGATSKTYTLTDDDKGTRIKCHVTYTDLQGTLEGPLYTDETGIIAPLNYPATGKPEIEGILREGEAVTGVLGSVADANGIDHATLDYLEWRRDGFEVIPGETEATYLITADDVGRTLQVGLAFFDDDGFAEGPLYSDETAVVQPYNRPATGAPAISGTVLEGETLQGELGNVADENGLPDISTWTWQWYREDAQVGTSARTYVLGADDVGSRIRVQAFFTDLAGFNESTALSDYTIYVGQYNRAATGAPDISGVVFEGNTLTAGLGTIADANGVPDIGTFTWQWRRSGSPIVGETGQTYVIGPADVGSTLSVGAKFTDLAGYEEGWLYSAETITVPGTNQPPTGIPVITGNAVESEVLTCDTSGIADPDGIDQGSWVYQWVRDGNDVPGQQAQTYTLGANDVGYAIVVYVHFDDLGGTYEGPLISDPTDIVIRTNRVATGKPAITGTAEIEQVLTCTEGNVADANGLPDIAEWTFQWNRDGAPIAGATSVTYTVDLADQGAAITVSVSFTDNDGYSEGPLTSDPTAAVPIAAYFKDFSLSDNTGWTHTRGSEATMHDYLGNIVTVNGTDAHDEAFVGSEYTDPDTYVDHNVGYGIQLEDETTNLRFSSNDPSDTSTGLATGEAWTHNAVETVTQKAGDTSPHGYDGWLITPNTSSTWHGLRPLHNILTSGVRWTHTSWWKPNGCDWIQVTGSSGYAIEYCNINIRTGELGNNDISDFEVKTEPSTNGYMKVMVSATSTGTGVNRQIIHAVYGVDIGGRTQAWAGDGVSGALLAGMQIEEGYSTSYIPTITGVLASVTRAATSLSAPFSDLPPLPAGGVVNDFCGQVIFHMRSDFADLPQWAEFFTCFASPSNSSYVRAYRADATNVRLRWVTNSVTFDANVDASSWVAGKVVDIRWIKRSVGSSYFWIDGEKALGRETTDDYTDPVNTIHIGHAWNGDFHNNIEHQYTRIIPAALTDEEIEAWPTWTEPLPIITQQPTPIDFGGAPPPSVSSSLALLFSDLVDGLKSGWHDDSSKGAAVTVWGSGFDATTLSNNKIIFTLSGTAYELPAGHVVEVVQDPHVFFLQRLTFHLWDQLPDGDHTFVVKVGEVETEQLPFHVRSTGRHFYFDANAASNGTGTWADPFRRPTDHFTSGSASDGSTAAGDHYWLKAGTYTETNGVIYLYGSRCVSASENNRISFSAVPTHDVLLENWLTHGGSNIAIWGFGGSSEPDGTKSWFVLSKFRIDGGKGSINLSDSNEVRVVGCECNGLKGDSTTTGDIAWGGSSGIACNNIKILGCEFRGGTTQQATDHAVYPGSGGAFYGTQDIAYCYIHDNDYADGQLIGYHFNQSGQQRIPDGERYMGSRCHHNLVDTRIPGTPAHGQLSTVGIRVSIIDARDAGRLPTDGKKEGEPVYVYNNVIICDSAEATDNASYGIIVTSNTADSYVCNNTIINGTHKGAVGFEGDSPSNGITFRANYSGNVMTSDTDNGNPYFRYSGGTAVNVTITAADNVYFNGNSGNLIPNESNAIQSDPQMTYDLANLATTSITVANGSPVTNALQIEHTPNRARDYNHRIVSGPPYDAGAIKPEDPA